AVLAALRRGHPHAARDTASRMPQLTVTGRPGERSLSPTLPVPPAASPGGPRAPAFVALANAPAGAVLRPGCFAGRRAGAQWPPGSHHARRFATRQRASADAPPCALPYPRARTVASRLRIGAQRPARVPAVAPASR